MRCDALVKWVLALVLLFISPNRGQDVSFTEGDFRSSGNVARVEVYGTGEFSSPVNVRLRPLTVGQYLAMNGSGCYLNPTYNPAEDGDFNPNVLEGTLPANRQSPSVVLEVALPQDAVVEGTEVFVILLEVPGYRVSRGCTIVYIQEEFTGQVLRWTRNGEVVASSLSLEFPENSGSQLLITAERLVPTEVTIEITASIILIGSLTENMDFKLNRSYSIPPERSSVNITIDILQDELIEDDENMKILLTARASGIISGGSQATRAVTVTILDNEDLNYIFLNTSEVISVTEGETVTVTSGIDPTVSEFRGFQLARIIIENGTAFESVDFTELDTQLPIEQGLITPTTINTIFRPGIQPTRTFTVKLLKSNQFPIHQLTHVRGTVTINIIDDSGTPLAPTLDTVNFSGQNKRLLTTSWSHITTDRNPVESFLVIIKSCSEVPCNIDSDTRQPGEIRLSVAKDSFKLERQTAFSMPVASIVICAVNSLGRNCSSSFEVNVPIVKPLPTSDKPKDSATLKQLGLVTTEKTHDRRLLIFVVPIIVVLILLCCLFVLLLICCCCCYSRRNKEISYYPGKTKGRQLKGQSSTAVEVYEEKGVKASALKYV